MFFDYTVTIMQSHHGQSLTEVGRKDPRPDECFESAVTQVPKHIMKLLSTVSQ